MINQQTKACKSLWAAVFHDGILGAAKCFYGDDRLRAEYNWFLDNNRYVGSFVWLCDVFDLDPWQARMTARDKFRQIANEDRRLQKKLEKMEVV